MKTTNLIVLVLSIATLIGCQKEELENDLDNPSLKSYTKSDSFVESKNSHDAFQFVTYNSIDQAIQDCEEYTITPGSFGGGNIDAGLNSLYSSFIGFKL